jgi:hypothetical protein
MAAELHGPAPTLTEVARAAEPHLSELLALRPYRRHPEFAAPDGVSVVTR